ncbi:P-loop NTPase fold protein [Paraburkholderia terrae]
MSLKETKERLIQALGDDENRVIALSGKWGTGKSHLWRDVEVEAEIAEAVKKAVYVSLFGLREMNELKLKAVQGVMSQAGEKTANAERIRTALRGAKKVLESLHKGFSALDEIALLTVPSLLKGKLIVLDDIERKHEKLGLDEVMGFIDEFTTQHQARFLLILNDDQLDQRALWDTLREKVIDQEIRLITTPEEAFAIAKSLTASRYSATIRQASTTCGLDNIRVIRKTIRAVNQILGDRDLDDAVLARVVPSTVLLSAIHFKGLADGPDFQFVLSTGSVSDWAEILAEKEKDPGTADERRARWRSLLEELDIRSCDEFEQVVVDFLESGQFDVSAVSTIISRYVAETEALKARDKAHRYMRRLTWDTDVDEAELVEIAKTLVPDAKFLDAYSATDLCSAVASLPGGADVGNAIVQDWIEHFRTLPHEGTFDEDLFDRPLHDAIRQTLINVEAQARARATLFETVQHIVKQSGWGTREELVMKTATAADFESQIRSLSMDDRAFFMRHMLRMRIERRNYDSHFGMATERFTEACRAIVTAPNPGRLGTLVRRLFKDANLESAMDLGAPALGATTVE